MSAVSVMTAFMVLMILLIFMTTAVAASQKVLLDSVAADKLEMEAEEKFYLSPEDSEVLFRGIHFVPQNGGAEFALEDASFYRQAVGDERKTVILYGFTEK